jgi:alpha-beta hydrolase superfamily lysophospholipase
MRDAVLALGNEMKTFCFVAAKVAFILSAVISVANDFDSGGVKIHYAVEGEGEPVILIHGLYSSGRVNWDLPGTTRLLAEKYRVIRLDCRGHGKSDKPAAEDAYGTNMVEDVVRLMNHLGVKKARLVGYSMGAMIAMKLAVTHPDHVSQLVLCGMGWQKAAAPLRSSWEGVKTNQFNVPPACARSLRDLAVTEAEIKAVNIPVAMIVGDRDPAREWYVEPAHRVRPDWPIHLIADANHLNCPGKREFKAVLKRALEEPQT